MNTIFKTLILLSAFSFCLSQPWFGNSAINLYLTRPAVAQYYTWWNNMKAANTAGAPFLTTCHVDFRNVTSATSGCTAAADEYNANATFPSNCYPFVAPVNFLQFANDADYINSWGYTIYNLSYYGDPTPGFGGYVHEILNSSLYYNNAACNETTTSNYTSTYGDGQLFAGILQEILAIDLWYLEELANCASDFPSNIQSIALKTDIWAEFYGTIIPYILNHVLSGTPNVSSVPTLGYLFSSNWASNLTRNTSAPQIIIFEDLLSLWDSGNAIFDPVC